MTNYPLRNCVKSKGKNDETICNIATGVRVGSHHLPSKEAILPPTPKMEVAAANRPTTRTPLSRPQPRPFSVHPPTKCGPPMAGTAYPNPGPDHPGRVPIVVHMLLDQVPKGFPMEKSPNWPKPQVTEFKVRLDSNPLQNSC